MIPQYIFFKFHNNEDYINVFLFKESNPGYWELTFDKWNCLTNIEDTYLRKRWVNERIEVQ